MHRDSLVANHTERSTDYAAANLTKIGSLLRRQRLEHMGKGKKRGCVDTCDRLVCLLL